MFWGARFSLVYVPTSADASFTQKLQDGGRIPEAVITLRRKMISFLSQRLRHIFRARLIHLHWRRHRLTMESTIRYKPEVETVSQTGSSNNLASYTDVYAISVAIAMFLEQVFHWCIRQHHPTLHSHRNSKIADVYWSPEVIITLQRKPTST